MFSLDEKPRWCQAMIVGQPLDFWRSSRIFFVHLRAESDFATKKFWDSYALHEMSRWRLSSWRWRHPHWLCSNYRYKFRYVPATTIIIASFGLKKTSWTPIIVCRSRKAHTDITEIRSCQWNWKSNNTLSPIAASYQSWNPNIDLHNFQKNKCYQLPCRGIRSSSIALHYTKIE